MSIEGIAHEITIPQESPKKDSVHAHDAGKDKHSVNTKTNEVAQGSSPDVHASRGLLLEVDKDTGIVVAKIVDNETKEVLRQMPVKQMVELAKYIKESGKIVNATV